MVEQKNITFETKGREFIELSQEIRSIVASSQINNGLCNLFIQHTSASLIICENADPDVLVDLERFVSEFIRDGDQRFRHRAEGPDDMAAHLRSVLTQTSLSIPVQDQRLVLGTWQGVYLWEHRLASHRRTVTMTIVGD